MAVLHADVQAIVYLDNHTLTMQASRIAANQQAPHQARLLLGDACEERVKYPGRKASLRSTPAASAHLRHRSPMEAIV